MSHNPELLEHVDVFPSNSLNTALAFVKGQPVTKAAISLAAVNIESYACGQFFGSDPIPMMNAIDAFEEVPSQDDCEEAIVSLIAQANDPKAMKAAGGGQWLTILKALLPLILQLLG